MKKLITLLLAAVTCLTLLAGCAESTTEEEIAESATDTVEPEETVDMNYVPELDPNFSVKNKTLKLLINTWHWPADDIWVEEDSDDAVDSAIYKRNHTVMDTYGFDIQPTLSETVATDVRNADKSGSADYDCAIFCCMEACPLASEGIFLDLTSVENLNLDKHYWDQDMYEDLSIDHKLFYITGDLSTKAGAGTFIMLYNKRIAQSYDLENLYDLVREGKWTIDKLNEIVSAHGYQDDGDGQLGIEDTFGMGIQIEVYLALYFGCGGRIIVKDNDDLPVYKLNTEKNLAVVEKVYDLTCVDNKCIDAHKWLNYTGTDDFASNMAFREGRALFIALNASNVSAFREMEDDFGVLPCPKFDEAQEDYCSYVYHGASVFCIPRNCTDPAFVGYALEALAAESYKTVTPAYYDKTLYGQYQRDSDSYEMLDIAFRNRLWDLGYYAKFANIDSAFIYQLQESPSSFVSFASSQKAVTKKIQQYIKAYEESSRD